MVSIQRLQLTGNYIQGLQLQDAIIRYNPIDVWHGSTKNDPRRWGADVDTA